MLKYFPIYTTSDYKSIGNVYPQATHSYTADVLMESLKTDLHHYTAYESMKNIHRQKAPENIVWEFTLDPNTIFTDVLSSSSAVSKGFLISHRLFEFLSTFKTNEVDFIACIVHNNDTAENYHYLYPRESLMDKHIDIAATTFVLQDSTDESFRFEFKAKNKQHYRQRMANAHHRRLTTKDGLYFNNFLPSDDIIELEHFKQKLFVSERLHDFLRTSNLTGFELGDSVTIYRT
jgi:hypothetical protein